MSEIAKTHCDCPLFTDCQQAARQDASEAELRRLKGEQATLEAGDEFDRLLAGSNAAPETTIRVVRQALVRARQELTTIATVAQQSSCPGVDCDGHCPNEFDIRKQWRANQ